MSTPCLFIGGPEDGVMVVLHSRPERVPRPELRRLADVPLIPNGPAEPVEHRINWYVRQQWFTGERGRVFELYALEGLTPHDVMERLIKCYAGAALERRGAKEDVGAVLDLRSVRGLLP